MTFGLVDVGYSLPLGQAVKFNFLCTLSKFCHSHVYVTVSKNDSKNCSQSFKFFSFLLSFLYSLKGRHCLDQFI